MVYVEYYHHNFNLPILSLVIYDLFDIENDYNSEKILAN